jgi:Protein of unknown function (DUF3455)
LYDISCIWETQEFESIQDEAFEIWSKYSGSDPFEESVRHDIEQTWHIEVIGQHHFIEENHTLFPEFNFTSAGVTDNFVVANKTADSPAPRNSSENIDWLELKKANVPNPGQLANEVFRVFTRGGQPPHSVSPRSPCLSAVVIIVCSARMDRLTSRSSILHNIVRTNDFMASKIVFLTTVSSVFFVNTM